MAKKRKKKKKKKHSLALHSLVLDRLDYFKRVYESPIFRRVVKNLNEYDSWEQVQKELVAIDDNNVRGAIYEEIARAIIKSVKEFTDLYKEVYFNKYPSDVKHKLVLENGDFGIDAVGLTHDGEYHAFQMKHKIDPDDNVYWSADKMGNFYGEAEKAARLIVMSNTLGACRHFKLKAGPRYKNFGKDSLGQLDNKTLTKMGKVLQERIDRFDKLTAHKLKSELSSMLMGIGFGLFKKLRKKYPEWEIEIDPPESKVLYTLKNKEVYAPDFDDEDGIQLYYRFYFVAKKAISDEEFFDILADHGFGEGYADSFELDLQSPYNFNSLRFYAPGKFILTIGENFKLGDPIEVDEHLHRLLKEAEDLEGLLLKFLKDLNKKMSFNK